MRSLLQPIKLRHTRPMQDFSSVLAHLKDTSEGADVKLRAVKRPSTKEYREVLKLSGVAPRHKPFIAADAHAAPADITLRAADQTDFRDTPLQIIDAVRERMMELKAEKLNAQKLETYVPRRAREASAQLLGEERDDCSSSMKQEEKRPTFFAQFNEVQRAPERKQF